MRKIYRDHTIILEQETAKFAVEINGINKTFASLKSAKNAIDREAVIDFKPTEVLMMEEEGYSPATYNIKKVKLIGYEEKKTYRGYLKRFYKTEKGKEVEISYYHSKLYPVSALKKLEANIKETNEIEQQRAKTEKRLEVLRNQRDRLMIDLDPRPELKDYEIY